MKNKKYKDRVSENSVKEYTTCDKNSECTDRECTCGCNDGGCSYGARLFTQRELEKCIGERLMRERRNNFSLELLRKTVDRLRKGGILNADSYAEAADELCKKLEALYAGNTREEKQQEVSSEAAMEVSEENEGEAHEPIEALDGAAQAAYADASAENGGKAENAEKSSAQLMREYGELCERYPHTDIENLLNDESFKRYCNRKSGSLTELYEGFMGLMLSLEKFGEAVRSRAAEAEPLKNGDFPEGGERYAVRSLSSTGFSKGSASARSDTGALLSPLQRDIARRAGISYREYAELMRDIPDAGKIRRQMR